MLVKQLTDESETRHYVDIDTGMFDAKGEVRWDMVEGDGLHLKRKAYRDVFTPQCAAKLKEVWELIGK